MTQFFKKFISKHEKVMREHGKKFGFDYDELMNKAVYLSDIDYMYAEKVWKTDRGLEELYELVDNTQHLEQIKIPTLCISTLDDPICPAFGIPLDKFK
jgi:predicted alpha/beta-fold hydrolase